MKKAFTLIELLVVIAIIAILAAILFPVFAQAKTAAKKAAAISNQKQISLGFMMYLSDNDDIYPRRSGCEVNSSLNPILNDGVTRCGGAAGFGHSMTWQAWQKYVFPYVKNIDLFVHPMRQRNGTDWTANGQILNSFVVNLGITGSATAASVTTPWFGGSQTGIPNVAGAMLLIEMPNTYAVPVTVQSVSPIPAQQTVFPMAIREYWRSILLTSISANNCTTNEIPDPVGSGSHGGATVGHADGSAKFYQTARILGLTPTAVEYGLTFPLPSISSNCRRAVSVIPYTGGNPTPNMNINYPFWGLGQ